MRKFIVALVGLLFTLPAFAEVAHWTCSNEQTVLYLVVDGSDGKFILFDNKGAFVGSSNFVETKTDKGTNFFYAEINGTALGAIKVDTNTLVLAVTKTGQAVSKFECN
jgi:hypothetical protein